MSDSGSSSRRQSRYSRTLSEESDTQHQVSFDSSQGKDSRPRSLSVESVKSVRKLSQDSHSRRISISRRISAASFFANLKKPAVETKDEKFKRSFENTYRLEPKIRFPEGKVRTVIKEALDTLESHAYSANHTPFLVKLLSARILENVKHLNIERYKVVCLVTIGSKESQGLRIASRCLWNDQFDTFVSVSFEGETFFAVGTVYGIYYE